MKNRKQIAACVFAALLLTGCQYNGRSAEDEALRRQIEDLESQVAALQQEQAGTGEATASPQPESETASPQPESAPSDSLVDEGSKPMDVLPGTDSAPSDDGGSAAQNGSDAPAATTETMESLAALVDGYTADIDALAAEGANSDMELFFSEKQRAEEIDRALDRHEEELERAVREGSLSREDYRGLERELERLEDRLDVAEDRLEIFFGMDD